MSGPLVKPKGRVAGERQNFKGQRPRDDGPHAPGQPEGQVRTREGQTASPRDLHAPDSPRNFVQEQRTHGDDHGVTEHSTEAARKTHTEVLHSHDARVHTDAGFYHGQRAPFSSKRKIGVE